MRQRLRAERVKQRLVEIVTQLDAAQAAALCHCEAQLSAIGEARVAISEDGRCQYCGRPITTAWPALVVNLKRAYGDEDGISSGIEETVSSSESGN